MSLLTEAEINAFNEALEDECHAWATYDQVIADFGEVPPFRKSAKPRRATSGRFTRCMRATGCRYPRTRGRERSSATPACEAGVAAEIANGKMYERLLAATQRPDILTVLRNLQEASQHRHLPAFQRCAQGIRGGGRGSGAGPHRGGRA